MRRATAARRLPRDVARFSEIVRQARERFGSGGPFLFGAFSAADAMFAPLVTRLDTYSIAIDATTRAYVDAILALPAFQEWRDGGAEGDVDRRRTTRSMKSRSTITAKRLEALRIRKRDHDSR